VHPALRRHLEAAALGRRLRPRGTHERTVRRTEAHLVGANRETMLGAQDAVVCLPVHVQLDPQVRFARGQRDAHRDRGAVAAQLDDQRVVSTRAPRARSLRGRRS
jgi:hypothetical protein